MDTFLVKPVALFRKIYLLQKLSKIARIYSAYREYRAALYRGSHADVINQQTRIMNISQTTLQANALYAATKDEMMSNSRNATEVAFLIHHN